MIFSTFISFRQLCRLVMSKFTDMSLDSTIFFPTDLYENNCNSFSRYFEVELLCSLYEKSNTNLSVLNANIGFSNFFFIHFHSNNNSISSPKVSLNLGRKSPLRNAPQLCLRNSPLTSAIIVSPHIMYMPDFVL